MDIVGRGTDALDIFPQAPLLKLVIWPSRFFLAAENVRPTRTILLHGALISKKSHSPAPARNFPGASATFSRSVLWFCQVYAKNYVGEDMANIHTFGEGGAAREVRSVS